VSEVWIYIVWYFPTASNMLNVFLSMEHDFETNVATEQRL